jgi:hypothetical protein
MAHRRFAGGKDFPVDEAIAHPGEPAEPQASHLDAAGIVRRLRARVGVRGIEADDHVEARGDLGDGPRHGPDVGRGREEIGLVDVRDTSQRGLEPDDAAARGGDADGAPAVGAEGQRSLAGGDRRRGAARRATRGAGAIPRVPRGAEERAVGQGLVAELGRGGLADEDGAGGPQAADGHRVLGRYLVGEDQRAHRGPDALGEQQILDRKRDAVQRADIPACHQRRLRPAGPVPGLVCGHGDEGVHGRLERFDAPQHSVDHRDG